MCSSNIRVSGDVDCDAPMKPVAGKLPETTTALSVSEKTGSK